MNDNWHKAKELAARPYSVEVIPDQSTDGEPGFYVRIPEMSGCVSDGSTIEEALENLESAKIDFIHVLLDYGQPVPEPRRFETHVCLDMSEFAGFIEDPVATHSSADAFVPQSHAAVPG